jgi:hypothetical protein
MLSLGVIEVRIRCRTADVREPEVAHGVDNSGTVHDGTRTARGGLADGDGPRLG